MWTEADEKHLQELQERKQAYERTMRGCVKNAVERFHVHNMTEDELVDALIENTTVIRKVLEPFDTEV